MGYGDPLERPAEKVLEDVLDGFCTVAHAWEAYGVVVDLAAEHVDEAATSTRRRALASTTRAAPRLPPPERATEIAVAPC